MTAVGQTSGGDFLCESCPYVKDKIILKYGVRVRLVVVGLGVG